MADTPEKKKFLTRLRDVFKRSAKPRVPDEIVNDKNVQKAVIKNRRKKRWRALRNIALVSTALSTITYFNPDLVSSTYDAHMAERGYTATHQENFHAAEVRVYDRGNFFLPFYTGASSVTEAWQQAERHDIGVLSRIILTPILYVDGISEGIGTLLTPSTLDAYSKSNNAPLEERTVFIHPPADNFTVQQFLSDFADVTLSDPQFKHNQEDIARVLYEYVMLHEARHGDQDKSVSTALKEADADRYAFDVLETRGIEPSLLQEVRDIVTYGRTMASVLGGGTSHATSLALMRDYPTAFDAYEDGASFKRLHNILQDAVHFNADAFDDRISNGNRMIYIAGALNARGTLRHDPELRAANNHFITAINFFQEASGYKLVNPFLDLSGVDVDYLKQPYSGAPDKLKPATPQKAPYPGS